MSQLAVDRPKLTPVESIKGYSSVVRAGLAGLLVALGYYFGAKIGFSLTFHPHPVSTLWPPNSILLAALLLTPKRWWWFLLVATLPAHLIVQLHGGVPMPMVLCWFISNCCEALIGATFIRHFTKRPVRFDTSARVAVFMLAAVLSPFLTSFLDAGFVTLNRWGSGSYWQIWRMRFFSNVLAALTLVPFIVMWVNEGTPSWRKLSFYRYLEAAALMIGLLLVSVFVLDRQIGASPTPELLYTPLPLLLWAAIRFGPKGTSTALVAVSFVAISGAINGLGPFVNRSAEESALSVQLFLILISLPLLTLSAVIEEQKRLRQTARKNEEQLELALNAARLGTWDWHITKNEFVCSDETKRIFGLLPLETITSERLYGVLHEDDKQAVREAVDRSIREAGPYAAEFRILQSDGSIRWVHGQGKVLVDEAGSPVRMVGVNADITTRKEAEDLLRQRNRQVSALAGRLISAEEDERRRLSRDLHDDLCQKVAALSLAITNLKRKQPETNEQVIAGLNQLYHNTNELTDHIRQLSHGLHPPALDHLGLKLALETYITEFQRQEEIQIDFVAHLKSEKMPVEITACLYRIVLEGLRNVAKHAHTRSVSIRLVEDENSLVLEIADQGVGFNVNEAKRGDGLGLVSAEERVRLLQGSFEIESTAENGTRLIARIPLRQ